MAKKPESKSASPVAESQLGEMVAILKKGSKEEKIASLRRIGALSDGKKNRSGWSGVKRTSAIPPEKRWG